MARLPGEVFPSERRYYFKEPYERLLDDTAFEKISAEAFRFRMLFRAMLKRGVREDGEMEVSRSGLRKLSGKSHFRSQLKPLEELADVGIFSFSISGECVLIRDLNYAKDQEFNPKKPRKDPGDAPRIETDTETEIEIERDMDTETQTETDTRTALREVKGAGGPKPTRTSRCLCPEAWKESDFEYTSDFLDYQKPGLELTNDEFGLAWTQFRKQAKGRMDHHKWLAEFCIWLSRMWPLESNKIAAVG